MVSGRTKQDVIEALKKSEELDAGGDSGYWYGRRDKRCS